MLRYLLLETAKPELDLEYLETTYRELPPKLKEVLPANIKEWLLFQKQLDALWKLHAEVKSGSLSDVHLSVENQLYDHLKLHVLGGHPYKHSVFEVTDTYKQGTAVAKRLRTYLFHGGFDLTQVEAIFEMIAELHQKHHSSLSKQRGAEALDNALKSMANGKLVLTPKQAANAAVRKANPTVIEIKDEQGDGLYYPNMDFAKAVSKIPNLTRLEGSTAIIDAHNLSHLRADIKIAKAICNGEFPAQVVDDLTLARHTPAIYVGNGASDAVIRQHMGIILDVLSKDIDKLNKLSKAKLVILDGHIIDDTLKTLKSTMTIQGIEMYEAFYYLTADKKSLESWIKAKIADHVELVIDQPDANVILQQLTSVRYRS